VGLIFSSWIGIQTGCTTDSIESGSDQFCGAGTCTGIPDPNVLFIPDLGFRFPDPTRTKKEEGEKNVVILFCSHKFHKIEIILFLKRYEKV
jgi:hypothetical protein